MFQFHNGAIQIKNALDENKLLKRFQFHNGAIQMKSTNV